MSVHLLFILPCFKFLLGQRRQPYDIDGFIDDVRVDQSQGPPDAPSWRAA
jgi:hypothetical protein